MLTMPKRETASLAFQVSDCSKGRAFLELLLAPSILIAINSKETSALNVQLAFIWGSMANAKPPIHLVKLSMTKMDNACPASQVFRSQLANVL